MLNEQLKRMRQQTVEQCERTEERMRKAFDQKDEALYRTGADLRAFLGDVLQVIDDLIALRQMCYKTQDIFDALGIWTGADDLLWDRLEYLLGGMGGYCDPEKTKPILDKLAQTTTKKD